MKWTPVIFLLFTSAGLVAREEAFPDIDIPFEKYVLANGLTLIVHEDHKSPVVALHVTYKVGSRDERAGRTGFAHLFEHVMFNGSEHYDNDFFRALSPLGATNVNGATSNDRTVYYETVPTPALDRVLWLESDRMGHLLNALTQQKLDEQRNVVLNEKRQTESQPYGRVEEIIAAHAYPPDHPYRWTPIGSVEDLNAATLEDVKEWFRTHYGAANAVLVLSGDVKPQEVREKVERYFGDIPAGPSLNRAREWVAQMSGQKRVSFSDRIPLPEIHKIWNFAPPGTRDATLLWLAAGMLETNRDSGRLYQRLVRREGLATAVMTDITSRELGSQLDIGVILKEGADPKAVEAALDAELARFLKEGPTKEELELAKIATYSSYARLEGAAAKAGVLASGELGSGEPQFYKQALRWIREATAADVKAASQRWLADGQLVLQLEPIKELRVAKSDADRTKPPAVGDAPKLNLPPLQRATLSNGLKIALAESHSAPVVQLTLVIGSGAAADSVGTPGTAQLTMAMLRKGTRRYSADAINARMRRIGAYIETGAELDISSATLNALRGQLRPSLELFSDMLLRPTFPQAELDHLKSEMLAMIAQQEADPNAAPYQILPQLVFGKGHAYATAFGGAPFRKAISSLRPSDLQAFYERWIRPDNATLLIVGDTTLAEIEPLLEQSLGSWQAPSEPLPTRSPAAVPLPSAPRVFLVDRPNSEQSLVVGASIAPSEGDPDGSALRAVNRILGGEFLSRLNMSLREEKNWSYGVSTDWQRHKGPGLFTVTAPVQTDKTAESIQELIKQLGDLSSKRPPTEEELKLASESMVLSLPAGVQTVGGVSAFYNTVVAYGLPDHYWNDFVGEVKALTTADLAAAARKLVHPEALTWIVVGDLAKIEAGVRGLNIGEVKVIDTNGAVLR